MSKSITNTNDGGEHRKVSQRAQYFAPRSGPPQVLLDNNKEKASYRVCEDEPIHIPGAIQNFGALLGMKYNNEGKLEVRIASENTRKIIGYGPEQLFALGSFLDVLKDDVRDEMVARIEQALTYADANKKETRLDVFQISLTFPYEPETRLWCALHVAPQPEKMVVCEFEEYVDAFYLKDLRAAKNLPDLPVQSLGATSAEDLKTSTTSASKPLPVLQIARQRKHKEFSSLDLFNALAQAQKQITDCNTVLAVEEVVVGVISELTGFHRVMLYRFDSQKNGCVDAELLNPQASTDIFRGKSKKLYDMDRTNFAKGYTIQLQIFPSRHENYTRSIVCRHESDFERPLDLTHAYLRAMSPIHNKYLANMEESISIVIGGDLWGLIACHGYGEDGIRVSLPIRELCRNIGDCAAVNIQQLSMQQRIEARRPPPSAIPTAKNPAGLLATSSADLLKLVDADFALLSIDDEARAIGRLDPYPEAIAIMSYLQSQQFTEIRASQNINADFPGVGLSAGISTIAGFLLIPLNSGGANDFLVFFRKSQLKHVKWAGNPHANDKKAVGEYLEPRTSFKRWVETIEGSSKEWTDDQLDIGWVLSLLYSRLIEIWRQKGVSNQGEKISSIRNSSRELRTPINAVNNYIELAIENTTDNRTRQILGRAQEASNSLVHVMEDLLRLTKVDDTSAQKVGDKTFNLNLTVSRVMKALQKEAQRKSLELGIAIQDQLPTMVKGDGDRFKQVLAYLTSNAFRQSTSAVVEINTIRTKDTISIVSITVQDAGPGMSETELDDTFQEFEQAQDGDDWLFATDDATLTSNGTKKGKDSGLAIIARYVRNIDGQIRVTSEPGKGTIFTLELPFENAPSPEAIVPRKLRNLFSQSSSNSTSKFPLPPSHSPPSLRSPKSNRNMKQLEAMVPTPNGDSLSSRGGTFRLRENGHVVEAEMRDQAPPSLYRPKSEPSSMPDLDQNSRVSFASMHVLVAEDNFVSQRMLEKKLSQLGYTVVTASDGQEAHDRFVTSSNSATKIDVILMDMKMPLVDGALSARMIRFWEKESQLRPPSDGREVQSPKQRVPIIAVASEIDNDSRFEYIQSGFDGWALKPLDFRRLDLMLQGVKDAGMRRDSLYVPGQENGGWFFP
ncbi:uncharacterized protein LY89DRAFT_760652 [Mollisia scopiformis]|uniref:Phytochrome n=1 Tax=Mollisia scopiformis TaxID=149040 RepID=A0A132BBU8_MOLSC|nr:uncharacterized protein LY89DRAFT_760652 [Mollisia scopiformis]KUJ09902.1 hypothetical protein LY89DRAFT_760652 [Mollisia scopiformis]